MPPRRFFLFTISMVIGCITREEMGWAADAVFDALDHRPRRAVLCSCKTLRGGLGARIGGFARCQQAKPVLPACYPRLVLLDFHSVLA